MREDKLPLRTVLENFINHVDSLEAKTGGKVEQYEQQFQELKKLTEGLKNDPNYACVEGEDECNRRKNRYKDILPYDRTRVVVRPFPGVPGSDYINANYIRGASGSRAYIASQGPLPHTVADFWRMVVECDVQVIVMASNETEGGKHKCECYWVENQGEEKQFGDVHVTFVKSRQVCPDFLVRTFKIKFTSEKNNTEERTICQFHYIMWPDHGVPDTVRPLLDMVRLVRDCQASETLPVLVHCSAGCGRTGTICAIDFVWGLLRTGKLTENLDLFGLVKEMRRQRVAMVQTREQYILLHEAVKELFRERLKLIDSHPYENVATDGNPLILTEKESDYEELFVSQEKQDKSTKTSTPTTTPSVISTPSGSLTRQTAANRTKEERDFLRRSSSTSSLDGPYVPPLPNKPCRPSGILLSLALSHTSLPNAVGDGSLRSSPMMHHSNASSSFTSYLSDSDLHSYRKRPPSGYSKMEKEAENIAQKLESRERERRGHSSSLSALSQKSSATPSPSNTPFSTPSITPAVTPGNTPNPLQGICLLAAPSPPAPPPRSRTPSPIISLRRSFEMQQNGQKRHVNALEVPKPNADRSPEMRRKSTEIIRRPSIQKLKELFEKSGGEPEGPSHIRLSRSASSITPKTNLSILGSEESQSSKIRRKGSLGSEENLQSRKLYECSDSNKLQICPPPPPLKDSNHATSSSNTLVPSTLMTGKPPSSPILSSPNARRRGMILSPDSKEEKMPKIITRLDDRPALPIKKSKSFRWSRPENNAPIRPCARSPELPKKKYNDFSTYFSLERTKPDHQPFATNKTDAIVKKHVEDFPSPKEGFKLSVYQVTPTDSMNGSSSFPSKSETKPFIPPKKSIGERYKNIKLTPLQLPSLQPLLPLGHTDSSVMGLMDSSPTTLPASYNNSMHGYTQDSVMDPLYDKLPSHKAKKLRDADLSCDSGSNNLEKYHKHPSFTSDASIFTSKEYVNARVMKSTLEDSNSPKFIYVPLPSKRNVKDKDTHDYANYDVGSKHPEQKVIGEYRTDDYGLISRKEASECIADSHKNLFYPSRSEHSSSSDYEPMDFGERATSVDEVFETVNYELLNKKENNGKKCDKEYSSREFYLNRDLDSLARQVYQDCQDYLLHGTNRSPIPSIMPKTKDTSENPHNPTSGILPTRKSSGCIADRLLESLADLEEVKSKVSVPPHGLRNRERRDSYRQAVSPTSVNYSKLFDSHGHPIPRKSIHKYEKIWFDTPKHEEKFVGPLSAGKRPRANHDSGQYLHDFSSNLDQRMNITGKEDLFKDKLKELQNLVSNLEPKKGIFLPDLSEEDLSSKDSGSTSSLLSKSGQSSKSSDRNEPIYVNATVINASPLGSFPHPMDTSHITTGNKLDRLLGLRGKPSVISSPTSPYGTIATATHPYKPKLTNVNHPFPKPSTSSSLPSNYQKNHTATLPARPIPSLDTNAQSSPGKSYSIRPATSKFIHSHGKSDHDKAICKSSSSHTSSSTSSNSSTTSHKRGDIGLNFGNKGHSKSPYKKLPTSSYFKANSSSSKKKDSTHSRVTVGDTAMIGASNLEKTNIASISARKIENDLTKRTIETPLARRSPPPFLHQKLTSPYLHPPPPKPLVNSSNSSKFLNHKDHLHIVKSATTSLEADCSSRLVSNNNSVKLTNAKTSHNANSNHIAHQATSVDTPPSTVPLDTSTTDTSDDEEGIFHKLSPSFWSKFIGNSNKPRDGQKSPPIMSKSNFFCNDPRSQVERRTHLEDNRSTEIPLSSPAGSPRPFSKALGKLKLGTKVAANFKSYLKGDRVGGEDSHASKISHYHPPLQKSASSGPSVGVFSQVAQNYQYPLSIPKKPLGPRDVPSTFSSPDHPPNSLSVTRPRQQYL